jgi:outer membrane protein TolC
MAASRGTAEQASRAYDIATVRYREGISTQTELNDSRIALQQAEANRATAARDLQVARIRLALLHDLPLGTTSGQPAQGAATTTSAMTTTTPASGTTQSGGATGGQAAGASNLPAGVPSQQPGSTP